MQSDSATCHALCVPHKGAPGCSAVDGGVSLGMSMFEIISPENIGLVSALMAVFGVDGFFTWWRKKHNKNQLIVPMSIRIIGTVAIVLSILLIVAIGSQSMNPSTVSASIMVMGLLYGGINLFNGMKNGAVIIIGAMLGSLAGTAIHFFMAMPTTNIQYHNKLEALQSDFFSSAMYLTLFLLIVIKNWRRLS